MQRDLRDSRVQSIQFWSSAGTPYAARGGDARQTGKGSDERGGRKDARDERRVRSGARRVRIQVCEAPLIRVPSEEVEREGASHQQRERPVLPEHGQVVEAQLGKGDE